MTKMHGTIQPEHVEFINNCKDKVALKLYLHDLLKNTNRD